MALLDQSSGNPPDKPSGDSPGDMNKSVSVDYSSLVEISEEYTEGLSGLEYSSTTDGENTLHVVGGDIRLSSMTIKKSGNGSSEQDDFYGTNAAVLVTDGSLTLEDSTIETAGSHANAIFAYGNGAINISDSKITTSGDNSGGLMVTGGGYIIADRVSVSTSGKSSAAIRSDRGGGTIEVGGGEYKTSGAGSPAIYSTAKIYVNNGAKLTSTSSEGVVIEGNNQVSLENVELTDTNTVLHGNSETYKNIFIYQSMSGDAEEGEGDFSADSSIITTHKGDTFFITNTTAKISLSGNKFINNDSSSVFLRASSSKWGTAEKNGGNVELNISDQVIEGDIVIDNISTLNYILTGSSFYKGAINNLNTAKSISLNLAEDSTIVLTSDSYVSELTNKNETNSNIYSNGYKLFVNGEEAPINTSEAPAVPEVDVVVAESIISSSTEVETTGSKCDTMSIQCLTESEYFIPGVVIGISVIAIIILIIILAVRGKHKKPSNSGSVSIDPVPPQEPYGTNGYPGPQSPSNSQESSDSPKPSGFQNPPDSPDSSSPDDSVPPAPEP